MVFSISIWLLKSIQYIENSDVVHYTNICKMASTICFTVLHQYLENITLLDKSLYKVHKVFTNG